jgi:hypothetical protein
MLSAKALAPGRNKGHERRQHLAANGLVSLSAPVVWLCRVLIGAEAALLEAFR